MMTDSRHAHYETIAEAIGYVRSHYNQQPELETVARHVHMSPFYFQKIFTEWAGVSPKKFLQHISLQHAKKLLRNDQLSLFDTAEALGMSGTGRLHDLFVTIENMTPAEYKNGGESLQITYNFLTTKFGKICIAATKKGICYLHFEDDESNVKNLQSEFPKATLTCGHHFLFDRAIQCIDGINFEAKINLHLKGTEFQVKVWHALLSIAEGHTSTYKKIAMQAGAETAYRAAGTAIGHNPVAYLIPCHRVIRGDGDLGGYMWGLNRKAAMLASEQL